MKYTPQQCTQYLSRIGLHEPLALCAETLCAIVDAHFRHVPYENLDILQGIPLSLEKEALFCKIVEKKRGGFCFELNEALGTLLESLGFSVSHYASRFIAGTPEGEIPLRRHHILLVHLPEGDYFCDAGVMREAPRKALRFAEEQIQTDGVSEYFFRKDDFYGTILFQKLPGKDFAPLLGFTMEPQTTEDFIMPTFYCEKHADSPANKHRTVGRYTEKGSYNLVGSELRILENGQIVETRQIADTELDVCLQEYFGIVL